MRIYSLKDRKLQEFGALFLSSNDAAVKRALIDGLRGTGNTVEKHPEDFDLYLLGTVSPELGVITPEEIPLFVVNVGDVLPQEG